MVDLPRTPLDNSVTQGPRSSVSGGEITSAFGELAANLDEAVGTLENAAIEKASLEGQGAVYKDEKGALKYDRRNPLSRAGTAFNRSARTAYVSQISMDARPAIANLEVEAKGNVGEFDKLSSAYLKEMLKGKDPLLKGAIQSELTGAITSSRTGMIRAQQARDIQSQDKSISARINMANEDAAALARSGGTNTREYAEQLDIIRTLEKEKVGNPLFAYSQAESDVFLRGVEGSHMAEAIVGQVETIYQSKGLKAAQDFAEKSFDDPGLQLSPAERARYRNAARGALGQFKAELKVERDEARDDAKLLKDEMEGAGNVNDEDVDAVARRLEKAGDGARAIQIRRLHALDKQMASIPDMSNREQAGALATGKIGGGKALPIVTGTQSGRQPLDLSHMRSDVIDNWEKVQGDLGFQVPVVSGFRDTLHNAKAGGAKHSQHISGNALDLDVSKLSVAERLKIIQSASAHGFTGIGVYRNSIHLDRRGSPAAWGPSTHFDSVPSWARETINKHFAGGYKSGQPFEVASAGPDGDS